MTISYTIHPPTLRYRSTPDSRSLTFYTRRWAAGLTLGKATDVCGKASCNGRYWSRTVWLGGLTFIVGAPELLAACTGEQFIGYINLP